MPGMVHVLSKEKLRVLRSMPKTNIAADVFMGEGSSVNVQGKFKELVMGRKVFMRNFCSILMYPEASLIIGEKVFLNNYCSINCLSSIEIGSGTTFGEGVKIYDHNHKHYYNQEGTLIFEANDYTLGPVKIGKNCWIGSNVTILQGVEIGDNVILGANSLIYKSIPANSIVKHKEDLIISTNAPANNAK
ncbi:MAG: acyltransferase [Sphingobacteriales bacterium]|nr:acyltransferase [Sphingobacteriales bacterium]